MEILTSRKNPRVAERRTLLDPKGRAAAGLYLAEGPRVVEAALASGYPVVEVWICETARDRVASLRERAGALGIPVVLASEPVLDALSESRSPQGAIAVCPVWEPPGEGPEGLFPGDLLVLADLQDPGNLGTMWRTAAAAGFRAVLQGSGGADPYGGKAIRAAAGAGFTVPAWRLDLDPEVLGRLRARGYRVVAATASAPVDFTRAGWDAPVALLVGQEGGGLPPGWEAAADLPVRIPMRPGVESLNAAQCATLLAYERFRHRDPGAFGANLSADPPPVVRSGQVP